MPPSSVLTGCAGDVQPAVARPGGVARARNAERSRQAILGAACEELACSGLDGTKLERVAGRAGVDKKLIYHYFRSKEQLLLAAVDRAHADLYQAESALQLEGMDPLDAVRHVVEFFWNYHRQHPELVALAHSENLRLGRHLAQLRGAGMARPPLVATLGDLLSVGWRQGVFRGGVDPEQLYISISGLCQFHFSNCHTLAAIFDRPIQSPRGQQERLSHVYDLILGYLLR
jgi:AcrR family transcriptional regulator